MRKVELIYIEVINETEQLLVFQTTFNNKPYAIPIMLNMALPIEMQDDLLRKLIHALANMTRKDAEDSIDPEVEMKKE